MRSAPHAVGVLLLLLAATSASAMPMLEYETREGSDETCVERESHDETGGNGTYAGTYERSQRCSLERSGTDVRVQDGETTYASARRSDTEERSDDYAASWQQESTETSWTSGQSDTMQSSAWSGQRTHVESGGQAVSYSDGCAWTYGSGGSSATQGTEDGYDTEGEGAHASDWRCGSTVGYGGSEVAFVGSDCGSRGAETWTRHGDWSRSTTDGQVQGTSDCGQGVWALGLNLVVATVCEDARNEHDVADWSGEDAMFVGSSDTTSTCQAGVHVRNGDHSLVFVGFERVWRSECVDYYADGEYHRACEESLEDQRVAAEAWSPVPAGLP